MSGSSASHATGGLALPDLRVVPLERVVLHEDADERRVAGLVQRIQSAGVLKNPPIVAQLDAADGAAALVVLDGANRTQALRSLGAPDIVVQLVDYDDVALSTWYHLVTGIAPEALVDALPEVDGLDVLPSSLADARAALGARECLAYVVAVSGDVLELRGNGDLPGRTALLRRAVARYKGRADIHRVQTDDVTALGELYEDIAAVVVFPDYQPEEILRMVAQSARLPTGITRHVIARRALRVNVELSFLWSEASAPVKNRWLQEWIRLKVQAGEVRAYEASTVLYDE